MAPYSVLGWLQSVAGPCQAVRCKRSLDGERELMAGTGQVYRRLRGRQIVVEDTSVMVTSLACPECTGIMVDGLYARISLEELRIPN